MFRTTQGFRDTEWMRYFFHVAAVKNSERPIIDRNGEEFVQDSDALARAAAIAWDLGQDSGMDGFSIMITDERGTQVGRMPIELRHRGR
jgi:hypothetical protein